MDDAGTQCYRGQNPSCWELLPLICLVGLETCVTILQTLGRRPWGIIPQKPNFSEWMLNCGMVTSQQYLGNKAPSHLCLVNTVLYLQGIFQLMSKWVYFHGFGHPCWDSVCSSRLPARLFQSHFGSLFQIALRWTHFLSHSSNERKKQAPELTPSSHWLEAKNRLSQKAICRCVPDFQCRIWILLCHGDKDNINSSDQKMQRIKIPGSGLRGSSESSELN